ncbi:hypothetical protein HY612_03400 [Candidatus Roizmanbacteria bacterium]|nr:hypothetical protein [Candidatus Roizmanbacteria bacterium]
MLQPNFAVYLGKEKEGGFSGFIAEHNFFIVVEIEEGINAEQGREMVQKIKDELTTLALNNLASFDQFVSQIITKHNFPTSFSLAVGYFNGRIMYLKTVGQGVIFLQRERNFAQIIERDNSASGYLETNDFFILTTKRLIYLLGSDIELKTIFDHKDPHEIVEDLTPQLKGKNDEGAIALLLQFNEIETKQAEFINIDRQQRISGFDKIKNKGKTFFETLQIYSQRSGKRKTLTFIAVVLILFIFIWSVVLGYQRRSQAELNSKIKSSKELVNIKLTQAEEVAFLNLPRSLSLISEAKEEVEKLKKQLGKQKENEIKELEQLIKEREVKIVKKEDKNYEEFFDLTVDSKDASGSKLYLEKDNLTILDKRGLIYILSLTKKSLDKRNTSEAKRSGIVSSYQEEILFYVEDEGIYKISTDGKVKKSIDKDKEWGEIVGMWIYNGNVYVLDSSKGDIYKYLVTEGGYSAKSSYLKGEAGSVSGANSLAIDSSVYIGLDDRIVKYTAGARDEFSTSWPEKNVKLTKIFTSADVEKVYGWNKDKGAIYILGKNGTYERQIDSSILTKASDFVVFDDIVYVLVGEKIYKIVLD